MRHAILWLTLALCAGLTVRQIPVWASDRAVWEQAARTHPTAVRPAVNLAAHYVLARDFEQARYWIAHARQLVRAPGRERERDAVLMILDRQELWIDAFSSSR